MVFLKLMMKYVKRRKAEVIMVIEWSDEGSCATKENDVQKDVRDLI